MLSTDEVQDFMTGSAQRFEEIADHYARVAALLESCAANLLTVIPQDERLVDEIDALVERTARLAKAARSVHHECNGLSAHHQAIADRCAELQAE